MPSKRDAAGLNLLASGSRTSGWQRRVIVGLAVAACLSIVIAGWVWHRQTPSHIAQIIEARQCRWSSASIPSHVGGFVRSGRVRLEAGLVRLRFAAGAEVTLEAPADVELHDPMRCFVHSGLVVAKVPESAQGFTITTPAAELIDRGTEFGVSVMPDGRTTVRVFDGVVDVVHSPSGQSRRMTTGNQLHLDSQAISSGAPDDRELVRPTSDTVTSDDHWITVARSDGSFKQAYVSSEPSEIRAKDLLLVKNSLGPHTWDRKAYLGFRLDEFDMRSITDAQLILNLAPVQLGYGSFVPDATFAVYGLTDEALDGWSPQEMTWDNAPANLPDGAALDMAKVTELGRFTVEQGVMTGTRVIGGERLADFLRRDTNATTTLIIVRLTRETRGGGLVHAFAARGHTTVAGPTLQVQIGAKPDRKE